MIEDTTPKSCSGVAEKLLLSWLVVITYSKEGSHTSKLFPTPKQEYKLLILLHRVEIQLPIKPVMLGRRVEVFIKLLKHTIQLNRNV